VGLFALCVLFANKEFSIKVDKSSSAELSEAINSMFSYYQKAAVCYVYLAIDCNGETITNEGLHEARWTRRGW
jgi:hypothetical protein